MELIDTHCHLTGRDEEYLKSVLENAKAHHVLRLICIGASVGVESARQAVALAEQYPNIWASVGVHPHDAGDFTNLDEVLDLLDHPKVVALGETGLDFYRDWAPRENQFTLFRSSIAVARECKKPIIIHCRDAEEETLKVLREEKASEVGGVFHCYPGTAQFAHTVSELGFLVSFTGNVTFRKATALREAIAEIPLEQIMLETDCPYMAPEPFRGKPSEPMHVYRVAEQIAEVKKISLEEVAKQTTANAERLFGL